MDKTYNPEQIEVQQGDKVVWHLTNVERAKDATHGLALPTYNVNLSLEPGETATRWIRRVGRPSPTRYQDHPLSSDLKTPSPIPRSGRCKPSPVPT